MEGNGSRMSSEEMGEERREVEKGVTEKGRGGRGLRLLVYFDDSEEEKETPAKKQRGR